MKVRETLTLQVWSIKLKAYVTRDFIVELDTEEIAKELAGKAFNNKQKKSTALDKKITVSVKGT